MTFKLDNSLGFILNRTNTRMKNNLLHHFKDYDVTPEQWAVLNRLWEREGISSTELAELTSKDQPTTVRMLAKLEKKGYITRKVNPEDGRAYQIFLTSEGRALKDKLFPIAFQALDKSLKGIDRKQIEQVKVILNKIFENLGG
ncbi:MarR family winged helix-turn-helix transcriptional regulator [Desulfotomaculum sp. 1211_IL3151]|uniref:MarR family winged helix-turn-helix transcriptional regulator n=1 Tax=Desulfotomaculum sp. 1211_IL3151 TaxID=3084055 RepID=UPI002FD89F0C